MYAIIETGGKQFRVEEGTKILVDRMAADAKCPSTKCLWLVGPN